MAGNSYQQVADAVLRRARRQGFVVARDVQAELRLAGLPAEQWKAVVEASGPTLLRRQGRFYHKDALSPRLLQEHAQQQIIQKAIRGLVKRYREQRRHDERRGRSRVDFIQPVKVQTEDGREFALLSRDISPTGIRVLGTQRLLGQKVHVLLPGAPDEAPCRILTRILWTCAVGDDLFENGGTFLEVAPA